MSAPKKDILAVGGGKSGMTRGRWQRVVYSDHDDCDE
jgi:thiamine phosphate synthase YjbQ (UPF0047 family)